MCDFTVFMFTRSLDSLGRFVGGGLLDRTDEDAREEERTLAFELDDDVLSDKVTPRLLAIEGDLDDMLRRGAYSFLGALCFIGALVVAAICWDDEAGRLEDTFVVCVMAGGLEN